MTWREMRVAAEANGYVFMSHGKKHDKYYNPESGSRILIERYWSQEVRPGIMKALRKEMFFDTVSHSKLIQLLGETIKDGRVISLIHK